MSYHAVFGPETLRVKYNSHGSKPVCDYMLCKLETLSFYYVLFVQTRFTVPSGQITAV